MVEDINLFKISKYSKIFISLFPVVPNTNIILASILLKATCLTIENVFSFFFNVGPAQDDLYLFALTCGGQ